MDPRELPELSLSLCGPESLSASQTHSIFSLKLSSARILQIGPRLALLIFLPPLHLSPCWDPLVLSGCTSSVTLWVTTSLFQRRNKVEDWKRALGRWPARPCLSRKQAFLWFYETVGLPLPDKPWKRLNHPVVHFLSANVARGSSSWRWARRTTGGEWCLPFQTKRNLIAQALFDLPLQPEFWRYLTGIGNKAELFGFYYG